MVGKMKKRKLALPWDAGANCPCESGLKFGRCCRAFDGAPRSKPFDLTTGLKFTGYDDPKCYLAHNGTCSTTPSLEHPISHNILKRLGNCSVRGMPGLPDGADVVIPTPSMGFKVLCTEHNGMLQTLDTHAGRTFVSLREPIINIWNPSPVPHRSWIYVDGPMLEAWSVKVVAGYMAGMKFTAKNGDPILVDMELVRAAITRGEFRPGGGMYICGSFGADGIDGIQVMPLFNGPWLVGVWIVFASFGYATIFDPARFHPSLLPAHATYRASIQQMYGQGGDVFMFFAWPYKPDLINYSRGKLMFAPHTEPNLDVRIKGGLKPDTDLARRRFIDPPPPFTARPPKYK